LRSIRMKMKLNIDLLPSISLNMRKYYFTIIQFLIGLFLIQSTVGQSIRKSFVEMSPYEISILVDALYEIRNGPDLLDDMALYHGEFFNYDNTFDPTRLDLHFNLPDEAEREIFLAWHRQLLFELEQALQEFNPEVSI